MRDFYDEGRALTSACGPSAAHQIDHLPHVADDEQLVWQFPQVSQRLDLIGWGEELVVSVETPMHQFQ
jgi:hypothetical protein